MKKKLLTLLLGVVLSTNFIIQANASSNAGWVQASNGSWNYNKADGSKTTGWLQDGKDWYYFWSDGSMATGWVQSNGTWYYLTSNGTMATDTVVNGYYVNSTGAYTTRPNGNIYTGAEIKEKVRSLGFFDGKYGGLILNPNGTNGLAQNDYLDFSVWNDSRDMNLTILNTNSEVDKKIRTIFNWILPTQGNTLYSIGDDQNCKSQTLELDGRTVTIDVQQRFMSITFGPIK
ncbi:autolysin [Clostridium saccharobutylicum]|uniref:Autolysin n=1 Tax=Clostridium saccharobutylicum TaxID=169679 RepID=A0A1S8MNB8_CLOSA|nr:autolysin [Clostridium saccharobutylicum]